jgi:hypothetical protein
MMPPSRVVSCVFSLVTQLVYLFPGGKEAAAFADKVLAGKVELELSSAFRTKACQS